MGALRKRREVGSPGGPLAEQALNLPANRLAEVLITPTGPNLSAEDQAIAERRFAIIEPLIRPEKFGFSGTKGAIVEAISKKHGVPRSTIYSWCKSFKDGEGLPALVNKDRVDKGKPRSLNMAALEFILAAAAPRKGVTGIWSVKEIFRAYVEESAWRARHLGKRLAEPRAQEYLRYLDEYGKLSPGAMLPQASYATFVRWFDRIPEMYKVMARSGNEAFANTQEILSFRNLTELLPLDYVVMDHRLLDLFCLLPQRDGWKLIRPWLTAAIDMRTRKWLAWAIVETPSSDSIASVLKQVFLKHGLPSALYWDNGKDFRCEWFEGKNRRAGSAPRVAELDEGMRGVLETLNIRVHHAIVRRARAKIIEPNFVNTANFDKSLPEWCGHKPTERPERFGDLMERHERWVEDRELEQRPFRTIAEIAWLYGEFLENDLNERPHTGEGMRKVTPTGLGWKCPNECWELLINQVPRRSADPEVIQFCFRKRRKTTIRHGEIRASFGGFEYHYRIVDAPTRLMSLNGREAEVAYDSHNLEMVAVYHEGSFIGLAKNIELRRMGEQIFVEDERLRRASRREVHQLIKRVHTAVPIASPEERALRRMEVKPERREPRRIEAQVALPGSIADGIEAVRNNDNEPQPERIDVEAVPRVAEQEDDAEFHFFR